MAGLSRTGLFLRRHAGLIGVLAAISLVSLALGVLLGSYLSCVGDGCEFRVSLFEAVGTWFGGIGTIAALLVAVLAFSGEERARARALKGENEAVQQRVAKEQRDADAVKVSTRVVLSDGDAQVICVAVDVTNGSSTAALTNLRGDVADWGDLDRRAVLDPGEVQTTMFQMTADQPRLLHHFPIRPGQERKKLTEMRKAATIRFGMHGRDWQKVEGSDSASPDD